MKNYVKEYKGHAVPEGATHCQGGGKGYYEGFFKPSKDCWLFANIGCFVWHGEKAFMRSPPSHAIELPEEETKPEIDWDSAPEWADRVMGLEGFNYWCSVSNYAEFDWYKVSGEERRFEVRGVTIGDFELIEMRPEIKPEVSALDIGLVINTSKYHREIKKGVCVDVYDVLMAFGVTNPAMQHALKKMLAPGQRGVKDTIQDMKEAIQSIERAIELEQS